MKKQQALVDLVRRVEGQGIVYVATVEHCEEVTRLLDDKPDIRFVAHYDMPGSLEAYYH